MDYEAIRKEEIRQAFIAAGLIDSMDALSERDLKFGEALLVPALAEKLISTQFTGKAATSPLAPPVLDWSGDIPTVLTLRDQFAMAALTGLLSGPAPRRSMPADWWSSQAYELADVMLEARKK